MVSADFKMNTIYPNIIDFWDNLLYDEKNNMGGVKMAKREYRVNVYDEEGDVIGRVRYNNNLDYWGLLGW